MLTNDRVKADRTRPNPAQHVGMGPLKVVTHPLRCETPLRRSGMRLRYRESRDGHNWENWRDRLRESLTWLFPGPLRLMYE